MAMSPTLMASDCISDSAWGSAQTLLPGDMFTPCMNGAFDAAPDGAKSGVRSSHNDSTVDEAADLVARGRNGSSRHRDTHMQKCVSRGAELCLGLHVASAGVNLTCSH